MTCCSTRPTRGRLCIPSDEDGFAQVLTEAMSVGCPVVTADSMGGGPRFVTEDGKYGLLVPRGDPAKLAEAMAEMLQPHVRAHSVGWATSAPMRYHPWPARAR